jgi:hypothetical protein
VSRSFTNIPHVAQAVILSEAKDLEIGATFEFEILRFAQDDGIAVHLENKKEHTKNFFLSLCLCGELIRY